MSEFRLKSEMEPRGDQPRAIEKLASGLEKGMKRQTLLGVTGSGKTFTMANLIARAGKPTLVISHNKTLAAQLYSEFKELFPENAVEYFISYYDYYQPEAYVPRQDLYIEKEISINEEIEKLRNSATSSILSRRDVIVVASVSCIYGLGDPEDYSAMLLKLEVGQEIERGEILSGLVSILYERNDTALNRGKFRVRGDVIEVVPSYSDRIIRIELFGDEIDRLREVDLVSGRAIKDFENIVIYPAKHFVTPHRKLERALKTIEAELDDRLAELKARNKLVEAQRLEQRTRFDMEMLSELGYCNGVENYARHLTERPPGAPPYTLLDYFPDDFLVIVDESHRTIPQIGGMYAGDRSRKKTLVEYGFRLPSALDNRPLSFNEFGDRIDQAVFVSATPESYEIENSQQVVEQIIRPTGLIDPEVIVRQMEGQVDDLFQEINQGVERNERVLVTTLTKQMAENLTDYLVEGGIRARYLHSDIGALERSEIIRELRIGEFDVLVGINLLREGLDLPEVSLVAILDADKEGFLRSTNSLIQTIGRAARNVNGTVIMYADRITGSMKKAIEETERRRKLQKAYNRAHGITPETVVKKVRPSISIVSEDEEEIVIPDKKELNEEEVGGIIVELEMEMRRAAENLEFEKAAILRDKIKELKEKS